MNREEFIEKKVIELKRTISISRRWSLILFCFAVITIIISILPMLNISTEFLKFGLSSISTISGAALQGLKHLNTNKLIELEYSKGLVDEYENLKEFDKLIVDKALA